MSTRPVSWRIFDPSVGAFMPYRFAKKSYGAVALAPFAHAHPSSGDEELVERDVGTVAAEGGDGVDWRISHGKKEIDLVHAHMLYLVKDRMPHRLAKAHFKQAAGTFDARNDVAHCQSVAGFTPNPFDRRKDSCLAPSKSARRFAPHDHQRIKPIFDGASSVMQNQVVEHLRRLVAGSLEVHLNAGDLRDIPFTHAF